MTLRKSKHNSSLEESIQDIQSWKKKQNFKFTNKDHKTHNEINHNELESTKINNNSNDPRFIGVPESKIIKNIIYKKLQWNEKATMNKEWKYKMSN